MGQQKERFIFDVLLDSLEKYEKEINTLRKMTNEKSVERELNLIQKDMGILIKAAADERSKLESEVR